MSADGTTVFVDMSTTSGNSLCKYVIAGTATCYAFTGIAQFNFIHDGGSHVISAARQTAAPNDYRFSKINMNDGSVVWSSKIACPVASCNIADSEFAFNTDKSVVYILTGVVETTNKCLLIAYSTSTGAAYGSRFMTSDGCDSYQDLEFKNNKLYLVFKYSTDYVLGQFDPSTNTFVSFFKNTNIVTKFIPGQSGER